MKRFKTRKKTNGYSEFFSNMIEEIMVNGLMCGECGDRLIGDVSEVAHILPKTVFKSIATNPENVIFLCSWKSKNNCHGKFDSTNSTLHSMNVYNEELKETVKKLLNVATETPSYKILDKWEL